MKTATKQKIQAIFLFFTALSFFFSSIGSAEPVDRLIQIKAYKPIQTGKYARTIWITIKNNKILDVKHQRARPWAERQPDLILETNSLVFPGLVDMHNHIKSNALPLWPDAKGQFKNRYEWRSYPPYKKSVRMNMKPISSDTSCAAIRWAELKALTGGVTAIQGIGYNTHCGQGFALRNLSTPSEFKPDVRALDEGNIVSPRVLDPTFLNAIEPYIENGLSYDEAYHQYLVDTGVEDWILSFQEVDRTYANALRLQLGESSFMNGVASKFSPSQLALLTSDDLSIDEALSLVEEAITDKAIQAALIEDPSLDPEVLRADLAFQFRSRAKLVEQAKRFIKEFLKPENAEALNRQEALKMLTMGSAFPTVFAVIAVPTSAIQYLADFQLKLYDPIKQHLSDPEQMPVITHLAEGQASDSYNKKEFGWLQSYGLATSQMVLIHGLGISADELSYMRENEMSLVWSPFSNWLLYGETLDYKKIMTSKVNLTIGSDWSVGGSKYLLDEMSLIRRYLNREGLKEEVSDRDIVAMATTNAAKALNLTDTIGQIKPGYLADLVFVEKVSGQNAFTTLVNAQQKNIDLVVINGEPLYGNAEYIDRAYEVFDKPKNEDPETPVERKVVLETLPKRSSNCSFQKKLRLPYYTAFDEKFLQKQLRAGSEENLFNIRSSGAIEHLLRTKIDAWAATVKDGTAPKVTGYKPDPEKLMKLDLMFRCEDAHYSGVVSKFILDDSELPADEKLTDLQEENTLKRAERRAADPYLKDDYSPIK